MNKQYTNQLIKESSPYLLQHAHNPVNWYPWCKEALEKAKNENKLILVSIGYAACHWCHVMEHESFEDINVASIMNEHFISIKVDREERPDIDQVYMHAVQLLTGRGGWPLNCICLPDGRPVYGGTYFPKEQWMSMLNQLNDIFKSEPEKALKQAEMLTNGVNQNEIGIQTVDEKEVSMNDLHEIFSNWLRDIDFVEGGQPKAPKFPLPNGYQFLLQYYSLTNNNEALRAVKVTLDKMAFGGIYDQIGGGFARYSTDAVWKVPHFEKMLYDNAQLVSLYSQAYQQTKDDIYKTIVEETLEFVERELTSPENGFYSSLDADSEGVEGKFYIWSKSEINELLKEDAPLISDYYNILPQGNWEFGSSILFRKLTDREIAEKYQLNIDTIQAKIGNAKKTLLAARAKRVRPGLDDKILTSWNALMVKGYVDAYRAFGIDAYLGKAIRSMQFIIIQCKTTKQGLMRNYKNGKATINAFLDDYAFVIEALIAIYQATFDEKWITEALHFTEYTIQHFQDQESSFFYYTSDEDEALIARKMEISDNVISSSNSAMAKNLFVLGQYYYREDFINAAQKMLVQVKDNAIVSGIYYANWDVLMAWLASAPYEVSIVGDNFEAMRKELDQHYLPDVFLSGGKTEGTLPVLEARLKAGKTTLYVCRNKVCSEPVYNTMDVLKMMKE